MARILPPKFTFDVARLNPTQVPDLMEGAKLVMSKFKSNECPSGDDLLYLRRIASAVGDNDCASWIECEYGGYPIFPKSDYLGYTGRMSLGTDAQYMSLKDLFADIQQLESVAPGKVNLPDSPASELLPVLLKNRDRLEKEYKVKNIVMMMLHDYIVCICDAFEAHAFRS